MKILIIRWKRLINEEGKTCTRCGSTGETVQIAFNKLKKALAELDIEIRLQAEILPFSLFVKDPLQSNRIWVGDRLLEEWIGGTVGQNQCCDVCGESECRTISVDRDTYETIPEKLVIQAGLLAAAELFKECE